MSFRIEGERTPPISQQASVSSIRSRSPRTRPLINPRLYRTRPIQLDNPAEADESENISGYEALTLSTLRVLFLVSGTIFKSNWLIFEQLVIVIVFGSVYYVSCHSKLYVGMFSCSDVDGIVNLVNVIGALAVLLLGFYTSNSLNRWWRLRTDGIGSIWGGCSELQMLISRSVTRDEQVLSSIRRYARASLMLQFMRARKQLGDLSLLTERNILFPEEVKCLGSVNSNHSEALWSWITYIVMNLNQQGLISSEYSLWNILQSVKKGRNGAALIGAQQGTPLPVQYVHILGFMVKLFNLFAAWAYAIKVSCIGREVTTHLLLTFFPALLYNSVLLINSKLNEPFADHVLAFPMMRYDRGIENDGRSYVEAGEDPPEWIKSNSPVGRPQFELTMNTPTNAAMV